MIFPTWHATSSPLTNLSVDSLICKEKKKKGQREQKKSNTNKKKGGILPPVFVESDTLWSRINSPPVLVWWDMRSHTNQAVTAARLIRTCTRTHTQMGTTANYSNRIKSKSRRGSECFDAIWRCPV